jgi:hypothetical protein
MKVLNLATHLGECDNGDMAARILKLSTRNKGKNLLPRRADLYQLRLIHTYHTVPMPFPCHAVPKRV